LEAFIAEKAGSSRYLLTIGNFDFLAETDLPLTVGQKLSVSVEQLKPQVLLRLIDREAIVSAFAKDYLRNFRVNPEALQDIFTVGRELLPQKSLFEALPQGTREKILQVLKIMDALVFSSTSQKNPLFIKDYIANLGLLQEYGLVKMFQERKEAGTRPGRENLKGSLLKLAGELQDLVKKNYALAPEEAKNLHQLIKFTESSVKAIETQQMVNVFSREGDGAFTLQIPFLFPDGIRQGEIFIETGDGRGPENEKKRCRVVMFLSMDALGNLVVEASLREKTLGCSFKFEDPEARMFFSVLLEELRNNLSRQGYDWEYLSCVTENDFASRRAECRQALFCGQDSVNLFI